MVLVGLLSCKTVVCKGVRLLHQGEVQRRPLKLAYWMLSTFYLFILFFIRIVRLKGRMKGPSHKIQNLIKVRLDSSTIQGLKLSTLEACISAKSYNNNHISSFNIFEIQN